MTGDLANLFEGKEVRVIEENGEILFPLADLAAAWGTHRNTLPDHIDRHPDKFEGFHTTVAHVSCAGMRAVNELGLYLLMGSVSTERLKNPAAAEAILRFQRWAPRLIQQYRKGEIIQDRALVPEEKFKAALIQNADIADIFIERYGYPKEVAHNIAITNVANEFEDTILPWKGPAMLPAASDPQDPPVPAVLTSPDLDPDYDRYFTAGKIAKFTGKTEDEVKNILEKEGLLSWAHSIYSLTFLGRQFGKVFITYPEWPHRTYERKNIRWSAAAVERVKAHIAAEQTQLASSFG